MYDPGALAIVDPVLTGFSEGFDEQTLHGERVMPLTPVQAKSGKYMIFNRADWLIYDDRREPGTVANEIRGKRWSTDTFNVREHSLQAPIHDEERQMLNSLGSVNNNQGTGLDPERDATLLVTRSIMLKHEKKVADAVRNTANYGAGHSTTLAGADRWDDWTLVSGVPVSDPVDDIKIAMRAIFNDTGQRANLMAIPETVVEYLENHPRVVARYSNFALTNSDAWRQLTGFEGQVVITNSVYNAANHVDATESITSFWGKDVFIGIVDPNPGQSTRTFGKTFAFPYPDGSVRPTDRWREEPRKSDLVRTSFNYDLKITSNVAGYIIKTVIS